MSNISEIDKNFKVQTNIEKEGLKFYDCKSEPFKIYGVFFKDGLFRRMPEEVARSVSAGVLYLHANAAGGRVKFKTDSEYIAISATLEKAGKMPHFALTGSAGFDLYADGEYVKTYVPQFTVEKEIEGIIDFGTKKEREITINFPLYSVVSQLYIGLDEKAEIKEPSPYVNEKPIVYYGSSITQGGCASRPGTSYQAFVSRRFNCDYINLGFSGNAKGEDSMIDYLKSLDMSMFVLDYDYNAPTPEHLKLTHEKLFKAVRREHPSIPIIIMSRPTVNYSADVIERLNIIKTTYNNAVESGDRNVYFIEGKKLCELCGNEGTVDSCHPTDLGFASMAKAVGDVIENIYNKKR